MGCEQLGCGTSKSRRATGNDRRDSVQIHFENLQFNLAFRHQTISIHDTLNRQLYSKWKFEALAMRYVNLGNTGLKVSRLCLGGMSFGTPGRGMHDWTLNEEASRPLIKQAIEA